MQERRPYGSPRRQHGPAYRPGRTGLYYKVAAGVWLTLLLLLALPAAAQLPRGERTVVRGGILVRPDSAMLRRDSLRQEALLHEIDSMARADYVADSLVLTALRTDDIVTLDSLARLRADSLEAVGALPPRRRTESLVRQTFKKGWFMSDSMSLSKVSWVSAVLPGYGQVYNRQYWKLPVLYGTLGAGLGLFIHENKVYKPLKREFDAFTDRQLSRTPELDALQTRMIHSNTRRQLYLGLTVASYVYFIGDAAVNYATNDVSNVKKATTLACIFPGAGQVFNKSYWKVPFVVGGFAAMIYCIDWNNRGYQRFKKAYGLLADYNLHPEEYPNGPTDEFRGRYSADFIRNLRNNYRRNRDLCLILSGALYILQIIDAHVDAHLQDYDVSDDLSMNLEPMVDLAYSPMRQSNRPVFGFNMNFKF